MHDVDSILRRIQTGLSRHGRKTKVSRATGISVAKLSAATKPDWNPTANTIRVLDAAVSSLFPASPVNEQPQD